MTDEVILYDPRRIVSNIFNPQTPTFQLPAANTPTASAATEEADADEARRRARAAAASRTGRRTTLLTGGGTPQSTIQSARRTLLGGTA